MCCSIGRDFSFEASGILALHWKVKPPLASQGSPAVYESNSHNFQKCKQTKKRQVLVFSFHIQRFLCASRAEHMLLGATLSSRPLPGRGGFMLVVLGPPGAGFVHTPAAQAQSRSSRSLI